MTTEKFDNIAPNLIFKEVPGFPDYWASETGGVIVSTKGRIPRVLKHGDDGKGQGRRIVCLYNDGVQEAQQIAFWVCLTWKYNEYFDGATVQHINGSFNQQGDDDSYNLTFETHADNNRVVHGLPTGATWHAFNVKTGVVEHIVIIADFIRKYPNVKQGNISRVLNRTVVYRDSDPTKPCYRYTAHNWKLAIEDSNRGEVFQTRSLQALKDAYVKYGTSELADLIRRFKKAGHV